MEGTIRARDSNNFGFFELGRRSLFMAAVGAEEKMVGWLKKSVVLVGGSEVTFKHRSGVNKPHFSISTKSKMSDIKQSGTISS